MCQCLDAMFPWQKPQPKSGIHQHQGDTRKCPYYPGVRIKRAVGINVTDTRSRQRTSTRKKATMTAVKGQGSETFV